MIYKHIRSSTPKQSATLVACRSKVHILPKRPSCALILPRFQNSGVCGETLNEILNQLPLRTKYYQLKEYPNFANGRRILTGCDRTKMCLSGRSVSLFSKHFLLTLIVHHIYQTFGLMMWPRITRKRVKCSSIPDVRLWQSRSVSRLISQHDYSPGI